MAKQWKVNGTSPELVTRIEKQAPLFVSRRGNSGRYDAVIDALKTASMGEWVVLGPYATNLEALRITTMRQYKHVRGFLEAGGLTLEVHVHHREGGQYEVWVRSVLGAS